MKKVLVLASVASMIDQFNIPNIELLKSIGYEVEVACNFENGNTCSEQKINQLKNKLDDMKVKSHQINFSRKVTDLKTFFKAYKEVLNIIEKQKFEFIHCHSPIGGVVGRLVAKKTKTKVIYTAHGFHFYKGAPLLNWLVYYPIEKFASKYTDVLITINQEDFEFAKRKMHAKKNEYVPGVGIDTEKILNTQVDIKLKKQELGIPMEALVIASVGELNDNKNHITIINALSKCLNKKFYYIICGIGAKEQELKDTAENLGVNLILTGFRRDISEILKCVDIFAFPSKREGLPVSLMEAMAAGLPVVASNVRGNVDLIEDGINGYLCPPLDVNMFSDRLNRIMENEQIRNQMKKNNIDKIKNYDIKTVINKTASIYRQI